MRNITVRKSKLYPNSTTTVTLNRTLGSCRFVWNHLLAKNNEVYDSWKEDESLPKPSTSLSYFNQELNKLKEEFPWLSEVSSVALQQAVKNLSTAFTNFFKGTHRYPKFKSKRDPGSFRVVGWSSITTENGKIRLPKENVFTPCRPELPDRKEISSYVVSKDRVGDFFISAVTRKNYLSNSLKGTGMVGVDLGVKTLAVIKPLNGMPWELNNPRAFSKYQHKRTQLSRRLAKKQKGSVNFNKTRISLAKLERKVSRVRNDNLHKFTSKLVNENQVISIEDLNVKGMVHNPRLAKHIADCGFGIIRRMLEYKVYKFEDPVQLHLVNRFYPSTQTCSACNARLIVKLTLKDRNWTCPSCGVIHDRDINAATNILMEGLRLAG